MNQQLDLSAPLTGKGSNPVDQKPAGGDLSFKALMEKFYNSQAELNASAFDVPAQEIFMFKSPAKIS